jgi:ABC-type Co2+ transport system permease subunit
VLEDRDPDEGRGVALVFMTMITLWSGLLATGFGWAAAVGAEEMSSGRRVAFVLIALFMGLLALRTGYELIRKLTRAPQR